MASSSSRGWYQGPKACGAARGRGPGEDAHPQAGRLALDAPGPARVGPQPVKTRLGAVDQHAVPGAGEQPGHREVGGVVARVEAPGRHERRNEGALVLLEGPLGDVALNLAAALVDGVRALAEAEIALARAGAEGDPGVRDVGERGAGHLRAQRDHAAGVALEPQLDLPAERIACGEGGVVRTGAGHAAPHRARGVKPADGGPEADPA